MTYVSRRDKDLEQCQFRMRTPKRAAAARDKVVRIALRASQTDDPLVLDVKIGGEIKFSLRTADITVARQRDAAARGQLERFFRLRRRKPRRFPLTSVQPSPAPKIKKKG